MLNDKTNYTDMIYAGALGFVVKTSGKNEFENAINTIMEGESYFSAELLRQIIVNGNGATNADSSQLKDSAFTEREMDVLSLLCKGYSVPEVADKLFLSSKTVEVHRSTLLKKTKTKNTINLVLYALRNKLVEL